MALSILSPDSLDLTQDFAGIHLGGTASANQLDDYEEGNHTATWNGTGSITTTFYDYIKIGNLVFINFDLILPTASSSATAQVSLPYSAVYQNYYSGSIGYTTFSSKLLSPEANSGGYLNFRYNQGLQQTISQMSGVRVIGSVTYRVN